MKNCSECMYWAESQPQAPNPQAPSARCYNVKCEKKVTLREDSCDRYYPRPTIESITVWVEDTDKNCICYAFRFEFEDGREYPMLCTKRPALDESGNPCICRETSEIDWEL